MSEFVVVDAEGQFLAGFALGSAYWALTMADALLFTRSGAAIAAARRSGELCEVIEDFGIETQRTIETVG